MQPPNSGGPTKGYIGENINEVEGLFESISSQVNEAKRKKDVCMFWMKNQCQKGKDCEYLHQYDENRIPVCRFFNDNGFCDHEATCQFRHPKPEERGATKKQESCPFYVRGFCKMGRDPCKNWHDTESQPIC